MDSTTHPIWIAFAGATRIASGSPHEVASKVKERIDTDNQDAILIFDAITSQPVELDLRGSMSTVLEKITASYPTVANNDQDQKNEPRTVGRPKLGVIAREVTLLPRHWSWLGSQPGGASVALRKLVEHSMQHNKHADHIRQAQESAYRFMHAIAGNAADFEEATRALFAGNLKQLTNIIAQWPTDIKSHVLTLAQATVVT